MRLLAASFVASLAFGQQQSVGDIKTTGNCSPVAAGNNNVFNITCGIGQEQGKKMLEILNKILGKQLDPNEVLSRLDGIDTKLDVIANRLPTPKKPARHLAQQVQDSMVAELEQTPGEVTITSFVGDTEAYALAIEIQSVFKRAKWTLTTGDYIASMTMRGQPWTGIRAELPMNIKPGDSVNLSGWRWNAVRVFREVSQKLSLEFLDGALPGERDEEVKIVVGPQSQ